MVVGVDFNRHIEENRGNEEVIGKHSFRTRDTKGQKIVDLAHCTNIFIILHLSHYSCSLLL